jgi:hypothetical protein
VQQDRLRLGSRDNVCMIFWGAMVLCNQPATALREAFNWGSHPIFCAPQGVLLLLPEAFENKAADH